MHQVLRYLKSSPSKGLNMRNHDHNEVQGYYDADYVGVHEDKNSTTGFCMFVGGNIVTRRSKKLVWCLGLVLNLSIVLWLKLLVSLSRCYLFQKILGLPH